MDTPQDVRITGAPFAFVRNEVMRNPQKPANFKQREALAFFQGAVRDCDEKIGKIMDAHQKSVAESAKKLAEYHKRKAREDRIAQSTMERRQRDERIRIDGINRRNMLEILRAEELNRRELLEQRSLWPRAISEEIS